MACDSADGTGALRLVGVGVAIVNEGTASGALWKVGIAVGVGVDDHDVGVSAMGKTGLAV